MVKIWFGNVKLYHVHWVQPYRRHNIYLMAQNKPREQIFALQRRKRLKYFRIYTVSLSSICSIRHPCFLLVRRRRNSKNHWIGRPAEQNSQQSVNQQAAEQAFHNVQYNTRCQAKKECLTCEEVQCMFHRYERFRSQIHPPRFKFKWQLKLRDTFLFQRILQSQLPTLSFRFIPLDSLKKTLWPLTSMV